MIDISDTELRQEVEDSLHDSMWLVNKDGISLNLTTEDKDRLSGSLDKGWLNDKLIDACHAVLHQARPDLGGLQSCLLAVKPAFRPEANPFLQIINTDPKVRTHWILLSSLDCPKGVINVYDSANCNSLSPSVQKSIAKLMQFKGDSITVRFMKCPQQTNGNDCGVYAIANAVQLALGVDPSTITTYSLPQCMRQHIQSCLEAGHFTKFSHGKSRRHSVGYEHSMKLDVYCSCHMPDMGDDFFECTTCEKWYHPQCQGLHLTIEELETATRVTCLTCYSGRGRRYQLGKKMKYK